VKGNAGIEEKINGYEETSNYQEAM